MSSPLDNYRSLIEKVDSLCNGIRQALGDQITCSEGCSGCCTAITVFPVEAAALREAQNALDPAAADMVRRHVADHADGERCPLLSHHRCLLYHARPIICRTHGLPILYSSDNGRTLDCCPHNLPERESLTGAAIIDLDRLNTLLTAVNALYLSQNDLGQRAERVSIFEALLAG